MVLRPAIGESRSVTEVCVRVEGAASNPALFREFRGRLEEFLGGYPHLRPDVQVIPGGEIPDPPLSNQDLADQAADAAWVQSLNAQLDRD